MAVLGVAIGELVVLMYMPIFELAGASMKPIERFPAISAEHMQWAREERPAPEEKFIEMLEERLAGERLMFLARLALTGAFRPDARRNAEQEPAFDLVPYAEASRRGCVALRSPAGARSPWCGRTHDLDCQDWIEERLAAPFHYQVAHRRDIAPIFRSRKPPWPPSTGVAAGLRKRRAAAQGGEEISFENISETDSSVVRLVNPHLRRTEGGSDR